MAPLSRIDHVIIAVKSLEEAANSYRRLGFTLTPRGLHEGRGTGNHCIMFRDSYIELLGIVDEIGAKGRLAERVNARGEGGLGIAYGADDADKAVAALRAAGIAAEDPNELSRPLEAGAKHEMVRFRNVMMPSLTLPNVMQFVCTHMTPELTRARPEWQLHPNGATGIAEICVAAHDLAACAVEMEALHGNELRNTRIEIAHRHEFQERFGGALDGAPRDGVLALSIVVNEPDATSAMLEMAKVPHQETRISVIVPASSAHGVVLEFAED